MIDFGSCIHEPSRLREAVPIERLAAAEQSSAKSISLADGRALTIEGASWIVQSGHPDAVGFSPTDRAFRFSPTAEERVRFDGPNKVRAELCGARRYRKGESIRFSATVHVDVNSRLGNADWCIIAQIHQADTKRADGSFVLASPLFALALAVGPDGAPLLRVTGETGSGVPAPGVFSPTRLLGEAPFPFGVAQRIAFEVVDGHGGAGRISVLLDGKPVVDRSDINVGYAYVDHLAEVTEPPQEQGSYLKFGFYAGRFKGVQPPRGLRLDIGFRDIDTGSHTLP